MTLIERLEAAESGSRELDKEVGLAAFPNKDNNVIMRPYTTSLDAALTLVPEGLYGKIGFAPNRANARIWLASKPAVNASIKVPQPALALCIAALRAREAGNK